MRISDWSSDVCSSDLLVGEGDGEDLAGRARLAGDQQVGEPGGQHAGLAGAGAGQHQHRAVERLDRSTLAFVEGAEIGVGPRRTGVRPRGREEKTGREPGRARVCQYERVEWGAGYYK